MPGAKSLQFAVAVLPLLLGHGLTQQPHVPVPTAQAQAQDLHTPIPRPITGETVADNDVQRQQAIAANEKRQLEIRRDTEKMLELTAELKDYLQTAGQGVMSVEAIRKAEQIEKLAHGVKSRMKQSF